jgi:hypothetical protein
VLGPIPLAAAWLGLWVWVPAPTLGLIHLLLVFPNGRLLGPRWRLVALLAAAGAVFLMAGIAMSAPGGLRGISAEGYLDRNSIPAEGIGAVIGGVGVILLMASAIGAALSIILRFHRASGVERLQVRWLALGGALSAGGVVAAFAWSMDAYRVALLLVIAVLPICVAIAILRYRLYEIDRIISRTVSYAVLSGLLALTFAGLVLGIQALLGGFTEGDTLAVAASTLAVVALFQPLRQRIQRVVDRRFNRARIDAETTSARFAERLRDEVDLRAIEAELTRTASEALSPAVAGTWLRRTTEQRRW